jgi:hypothetical protein
MHFFSGHYNTSKIQQIYLWHSTCSCQWKYRILSAVVVSGDVGFEKIMELRNHPLMSYNGLPNWPPAWTWIGGNGNTHPKGEVGILKEVLASNVDPANRFFLIIDYGQSTYIGCLLFGDRSFCRSIRVLVENYCGHSIQDIGSLDLRHTF